MSENIEKHRMDFLLENYKTLREEILESIRLQNRIIMGEAIAVGIILGFGLTETAYKVLIIAIPFVIIILNSYWAVEQSRMMRAGNFMQFLEDKINLKLEGAYIVWENWLRRETDKKNNRSFVQKIIDKMIDWAKPKDPHIIHHRAQGLCILGIFNLLGVIIIVATLYYVYQYGESLFTYIDNDGVIVFLGAYLVIFILTAIPVVQIILHRGSLAEKKDFKDWSEKYWTNMNKTYSTWWGRP